MIRLRQISFVLKSSIFEENIEEISYIAISVKLSTDTSFMPVSQLTTAMNYLQLITQRLNFQHPHYTERICSIGAHTSLQTELPSRLRTFHIRPWWQKICITQITARLNLPLERKWHNLGFKTFKHFNKQEIFQIFFFFWHSNYKSLTTQKGFLFNLLQAGMNWPTKAKSWNN